MTVGTIVFFSMIGALVVLAVVVQIRAWRRDRSVKRGERRSTPDLALFAAKQKNLDNARETLRNYIGGTGGRP